MYFLMVSGVAATRFSSGNISLGITISMLALVVAKIVSGMSESYSCRSIP
jgi:hypothetical protein